MYATIVLMAAELLPIHKGHFNVCVTSHLYIIHSKVKLVGLLKIQMLHRCLFHEYLDNKYFTGSCISFKLKLQMCHQQK